MFLPMFHHHGTWFHLSLQSFHHGHMRTAFTTSFDEDVTVFSWLNIYGLVLRSVHVSKKATGLQSQLARLLLLHERSPRQL